MVAGQLFAFADARFVYARHASRYGWEVGLLGREVRSAVSLGKFLVMYVETI
jgi:hypothetical protein